MAVEEADGPAEHRTAEYRTAEYLAVDDLAGLVSLVQIGVLEIHAWGSRTDDVDRPDRLVFDLDPDPGLGWDRIVAAAVEVRDRLDAAGLRSFVKTSGGKGLHVVLPIRRTLAWEAARGFASAVARAMAADTPDRYTATAAREARAGRIYVDVQRNAHGASAAAPYTTRARAGAPVSVPVEWAELPGLGRGDAFTVANLPETLARRAADPWAGMAASRQTLTAGTLRRAGAAP